MIEQIIIILIASIVFIVNIIQHQYINKLYKSAEKWKYHAQELQKELIKKTKYIDEFFHVEESYKKWERYQNDENNDI